MKRIPQVRVSVAMLLAAAVFHASPSAESTLPLAVDSGRVTLVGRSNVQPFTASSTDVRIARVEFAQSALVWEDLFRPGVLEAFDVVVRAATLSSGNPALDADMHRALKVEKHPDIVFRLSKLERGPGQGLNAIGALRVAGVEREAVLRLTAERRDAALVVHGETAMLMTDFGIQPPTGMLGAVKADPMVTIRFAAVVAVPLR